MAHHFYVKDVSAEEYSSLRNEINSIQEQQRNVWITMYTLYVAIFVLAAELSSNIIILSSYFILIPFQLIINSQNWSIQKISIYILCFYEQEDANTHWEGLHSFSQYKKHYKKYGDGRWFHFMGATVLGGISSLMFVVNKMLSIFQNESNFIELDIMLIVGAIGLFAVLLIINIKYKNKYDDKLMEVIRNYKCSIRHVENHYLVRKPNTVSSKNTNEDTTK